MNRRQRDHRIMVRLEKLDKQIDRHPYNVKSNWSYKRWALEKFGIRLKSCRKAIRYDDFIFRRIQKRQGAV